MEKGRLFALTEQWAWIVNTKLALGVVQINCCTWFRPQTGKASNRWEEKKSRSCRKHSLNGSQSSHDTQIDNLHVVRMALEKQQTFMRSNYIEYGDEAIFISWTLQAPRFNDRDSREKENESILLFSYSTTCLWHHHSVYEWASQQGKQLMEINYIQSTFSRLSKRTWGITSDEWRCVAIWFNWNESRWFESTFVVLATTCLMNLEC